MRIVQFLKKNKLSKNLVLALSIFSLIMPMEQKNIVIGDDEESIFSFINMANEIKYKILGYLLANEEAKIIQKAIEIRQYNENPLSIIGYFFKSRTNLMKFMQHNKSLDLREIIKRAFEYMAKLRSINRNFNALVTDYMYFDLAKDLKNNFLSSNIDVNKKDIDGNTALMLASKRDHKNIVELLINIGADINIQNNNGNTALMLAIKNDYACDIVKLLVNAGADINLINTQVNYSYDNTALMYAIRRGHMGVIQLLRLAGADINVQDIDGNTALMVEVINKNLNMVESLIGAGADIDVRDIDGNTALILAITRGYTHIVKLLIDVGADMNVQNKDGETALTLAAIKGHKDDPKNSNCIIF